MHAYMLEEHLGRICERCERRNARHLPASLFPFPPLDEIMAFAIVPRVARPARCSEINRQMPLNSRTFLIIRTRTRFFAIAKDTLVSIFSDLPTPSAYHDVYSENVTNLWRRERDSNCEVHSRACNLQILRCRDCRSCHACRRALPKIAQIAGENVIGGNREFAGSLGTQVVKIFELAIARAGLRQSEATDAVSTLQQ